MKINNKSNILIVGLGIVGGSYARGFTKAGYKVNAIDTDRETIDFALENNIVARGTTKIDREMIESADVIIFALYPHIFKEYRLLFFLSLKIPN